MVREGVEMALEQVFLISWAALGHGVLFRGPACFLTLITQKMQNVQVLAQLLKDSACVRETGINHIWLHY